MKVSLTWLQKYFDEKLPDINTVSDAFTFHSFEVEEQKDDLLDLDVLPDRASYALSHRGIALELSAALNIPMKSDSLREEITGLQKTEKLSVEIEDTEKCLRYIGAVVKNIKVGPSPDWLKKALESVGQRSINNVVDATNYVMLNIGQPLHAFDAGKLAQENGMYKIVVRGAKDGEKITTLSGDEVTLPEGTQIIADGISGTALGIAGIKGGTFAQVDENTTSVIVESASFDGSTIRRASRKLKLFTDASLRFQNSPSPELALYGMSDVLALITDIAGGLVDGSVDVYPSPVSRKKVSVTLEKINNMLGADFSDEQVADAFRRLGLPCTYEDKSYIVTPPFERKDINITEDLVEEVGRIVGYDNITPKSLPKITGEPDQARFRGIEKIKDFLVERGFTEISTQSFAKKGDIILANPLDKTKPALRSVLSENMQDAMELARKYAPSVLGPSVKPKLFEIGTVFTKDGEYTEVEVSESVEGLPKIENDNTYIPKRYTLGEYKPFSIYPFMLRDISVWTPAGTASDKIEEDIKKLAGELFIRIDLFDSFEKDGRVSYAFRIVFESNDRTLTDNEINEVMEKITSALNAHEGYEVR
ncbi:Phenylalanyl-tRNA synthetase beta chain [hydrothermal vent metagenome]|uniref:Phenylalanyl-tRNA synthetase beta chain n=1 Tax=hydrothermal vent metagenome TaxID=652676 RepID=A0A3B0V270_9ZZZZ